MKSLPSAVTALIFGAGGLLVVLAAVSAFDMKALLVGIALMVFAIGIKVIIRE